MRHTPCGVSQISTNLLDEELSPIRVLPSSFSSSHPSRYTSHSASQIIPTVDIVRLVFGMQAHETMTQGEDDMKERKKRCYRDRPCPANKRNPNNKSSPVPVRPSPVQSSPVHPVHPVQGGIRIRDLVGPIHYRWLLRYSYSVISLHSFTSNTCVCACASRTGLFSRFSKRGGVGEGGIGEWLKGGGEG